MTASQHSPASPAHSPRPTARLPLWASPAFALLRSELVQGVGEPMARQVFHRFGVACGQRDFEASSVRDGQLGDAERFRRGLEMAQGDGSAYIQPLRVLIDRRAGLFEADLVLRHGGASGESAAKDGPMCWALTGYLEGFATALLGRAVEFDELSCQSCQDDECRLIGTAGKSSRIAGGSAVETMAEVERRHILAVLAQCGGNRTHAARALGIGANTLWRKLKQWGVPPARPS